jgi:hypothetical protein
MPFDENDESLNYRRNSQFGHVTDRHICQFAVFFDPGEFAGELPEALGNYRSMIHPLEIHSSSSSVLRLGHR